MEFEERRHVVFAAAAAELQLVAVGLVYVVVMTDLQLNIVVAELDIL